MTVIAMPEWEERIDPRLLSRREKAALARYYAAEMMAEMGLEGSCDELSAVLDVPLEANALQMLESWVLHEMRLPREVNLLQLTYEFRELYRRWSHRESCGLLGIEVDGNGNFIEPDEEYL